MTKTISLKARRQFISKSKLHLGTGTRRCSLRNFYDRFHRDISWPVFHRDSYDASRWQNFSFRASQVSPISSVVNVVYFTSCIRARRVSLDISRCETKRNLDRRFPFRAPLDQRLAISHVFFYFRLTSNRCFKTITCPSWFPALAFPCSGFIPGQCFSWEPSFFFDFLPLDVSSCFRQQPLYRVSPVSSLVFFFFFPLSFPPSLPPPAALSLSLSLSLFFWNQ